jgi:hypothetical protein
MTRAIAQGKIAMWTSQDAVCDADITVEESAELQRVQQYLKRRGVLHKSSKVEDDKIARSSASLVQIRPAPPRALAAPELVRLLDVALPLLRDLVRGSSENKLWRRDPFMGFANENAIPQWSSSITSAARVLSEEKPSNFAASKPGHIQPTAGMKRAIEFMGVFIDQSATHLSRPDPLLFPFIYACVLNIMVLGHAPRLAWQLLYFLYRESEQIAWAQQHPLRLLIRNFYRFGPQQMLSHARWLLPAYVDLFRVELNGTWPIVQDMQHDLMQRHLHFSLATPEVVIDMGKRTTSQAEAENRHHTHYYLELQKAMAEAHLQAGRTHQAKQIFLEILDDRHASYRLERVRVQLFLELTKCSKLEGRLNDAVEYCQRATEESVKHFGEYSDWHLKCLMDLSETLEQAGRSIDAKDVRKIRDEASDNLIAKMQS